MPIDYDDMMQSGATGLRAAYGEKDVMLYALGVGFGRDPLDEKELPFVYENNGLKVVPTFASVINRGEAPPDRQRMPQKSEINFMMVVDGERRITIHKPLPPNCEVVADERYLGILDKGEGKGAVLVQERDGARGRQQRQALHHRRRPSSRAAMAVSAAQAPWRAANRMRIPERAPDLVKECDTPPDQAFLYALSGDRNPLHRDPAFAKMVGFPRPILHGLCSYGTACRAILSTVAAYQPERITQFDVRFSKPVFPGETLVTEMWADGGTFPSAPASRNATAWWCSTTAVHACLTTIPIAAAEALIAQGRAGEAARDLRARLAAGRGGVAGAGHAGQGAAGRRAMSTGALAEAREAASLNPNVAAGRAGAGRGAAGGGKSARRHRGIAARAAGSIPDLARARGLTGRAWLKAGEADKALETFARAGRRRRAVQMIARGRSDQARSRAPMPAMCAISSTSSPPITTRACCGQLAYAAPQILRELADLVMPGRERLAILDLGCGTGLAGAAFKPLAARLDGIDLSPAMIAKARARQHL